jgi:hypothetical protein
MAFEALAASSRRVEVKKDQDCVCVVEKWNGRLFADTVEGDLGLVSSPTVPMPARILFAPWLLSL